MTTWPILSVVTFLPTVGALLVYLLARGGDEAANRTARWIALWTTLVTFAVSLILVCAFRFRAARTSSSSKRRRGSPPASPTTWASTASRCRS